MKLSSFLQTKKVIFRNGKVETVSNILDGDVDFFDLGAEKLNKIKEDIIDKMGQDYTEERFLYDILPYICNIELDVDFETFRRMVNSPSVEFTYIMESVIEIINNILDLADRSAVLSDKIDDIKNRRPELFVKEETLEEKIIRLTKEMNEEKDTKKKKTLLLELAKLYEEVEKNGH